MSRLLTIVAYAEQPEADWVWHAMNDKQINGLKVIGLADGDLMSKAEPKAIDKVVCDWSMGHGVALTENQLNDLVDSLAESFYKGS